MRLSWPVTKIVNRRLVGVNAEYQIRVFVSSGAPSLNSAAIPPFPV